MGRCPPTRSPTHVPCPRHLPITSANYWLIVVIIINPQPPKAKALPISLFFDGSLFGAPNMGTNGGESKPNAARLPLTDRNRRHQKLGPWQVWSGR